jgi:hypothetical protein
MTREDELANAVAILEGTGFKWAARILRRAGEHDIRHQANRHKKEREVQAPRRSTGYHPLEPLEPLREIKEKRGEE